MRTCILNFTLMVALALPAGAWAQSQGCPPGLAKKAVPCTPPGQAKKQQSARYSPGEVVREYQVIRDPARYNLDPYGTYYRSGGYIYRVDRNTKKVLDLIGAVSALVD